MAEKLNHLLDQANELAKEGLTQCDTHGKSYLSVNVQISKYYGC